MALIVEKRAGRMFAADSDGDGVCILGRNMNVVQLEVVTGM